MSASLLLEELSSVVVVALPCCACETNSLDSYSYGSTIQTINFATFLPSGRHCKQSFCTFADVVLHDNYMREWVVGGQHKITLRMPTSIPLSKFLEGSFPGSCEIMEYCIVECVAAVNSTCLSLGAVLMFNT